MAIEQDLERVRRIAQKYGLKLEVRLIDNFDKADVKLYGNTEDLKNFMTELSTQPGIGFEIYYKSQDSGKTDQYTT